MLAGILLLTALGAAESRWWAAQPWHAARLDFDSVEALEGAYPLAFRRLPRNIVPEDGRILDAMSAREDTRAIVDAFGGWDVESLIVMDAAPEVFAPVLASGRLPELGKPEVLAGVLARSDSFELDGTAFRVVGRLKRSAVGLAFAYVLPADKAWTALIGPGTDARHGQFVPTPPEADGEHGPSHAHNGIPLTHPFFTWACIAAMMLIAVCGALAQVRFLVALGPRLPRPFRPLTKAMRGYPRLLFAFHAFFLGVFFLSMIGGIQSPVWNARMASFIAHEFTEGGLSHIGDAFGTGNPLRFAASIFLNNFGLQTFVMTYLVSIPPVALGVVKTSASFLMVGFGMAPLWVGTAQGYAYHSVTMTLEFEPYILSCFAVTLWPVYLARAVRAGFGEVRTGAKVFLSGILWSAVLLAIAALYEAVTIMLFN